MPTPQLFVRMYMQTQRERKMSQARQRPNLKRTATYPFVTKMAAVYSLMYAQKMCWSI